MINGRDAALNKQLPENQMNFRYDKVREYLRNEDDMMQCSENKSNQLIDCSPALDSGLRERAAEIGTRLKLVADQMDKDRGTIIQYWPADWSETRDAVSSQQWPIAVSLAKQSKKSSGSRRSENKCRPLSPAPHRPD
ncbi:hypothetical protein T11_16369 [Trichinella zimbabwensis]|uniref:Uncharacterized protein n=1 Tax=Trichinella zimbabwensis TaxID=268475 RepID=A0A0V1HBY5_9BILA|nr:hypothetical protein T11_16369 [Trichinella zimbabwensis]